mmetsp:Transcript_1346/g.3289  ORF Transcript_1346/g.3289 Transcript_1346/m.3289 type:complete len:205 (-) Transcript_1346:173-787(-)
MAFLRVALVGFFLLGSPTQAVDVWGACSAGPVGSCSIVGCYSWRGPSECIGNQCLCMHGYCAAGSAGARCRAQVGTCHVLPCNWNHGGIMAVECINGYCLCHSNYHNDGSGVCESGWWPPSLLESMNSTERLAAMSTMAEFEDEVDIVMAYAKVCCGWAMVATVPLSLAAVVLLGIQRVRRWSSMDTAELEPSYLKLDGSDASL